MRIRRGFLFWGLFFVALGVVPLLVRSGAVPEDVFSDIWRWWPVALIGAGVILLLGRSQAGLIGAAIVGLLLGTIVGSLVATGDVWIGNVTQCGPKSANTATLDRNGSFTGDATASFDIDCGTLAITTAAGSDWTVRAGYRGDEPRVEATSGSLSVKSPDASGAHRQDLTVTLGGGALREVDLQANAASGSGVFAGATLRGVNAQLNAGDLLLDGTDATIDRVDASVNAGRIRLTLDSAATGRLSANAGAIDLCVPADADLTFDVQEQLTFATNLGSRGLTHTGNQWTRSGSGPAIELTIDGNAASFTLDPEGGCK